MKPKVQTEARRIARAVAILKRTGLSTRRALTLCRYRIQVPADDAHDQRHTRLAVVLPGKTLPDHAKAEILHALVAGESLLIVSPCREARDRVQREIGEMITLITSAPGGCA
jgi:hypothetical protein